MRMMTLMIVGLMAVVPAPPLRAQLPGTDIYLAILDRGAHGLVIGAPDNVTRRPGYDNQPAFSGAGTLLYAAADTSGATDIFRLILAGGERQRVTRTPESEYSPMPTPDGAHISCVRVEADGTQRLWRFATDGTAPEVIAPAVDSVGYYAWVDARTIAAFIVGSPHALRLLDIAAGTETLVALDVGRSIHRIPGTAGVSFLQRLDGDWMVMRLDAAGLRVTPIGPALDDSQDCAWTPAGELLMAREGMVYVLDDTEGTWTPLVAFGEPRLDAVTRLAVDPAGRWIAFVGGD